MDNPRPIVVHMIGNAHIDPVWLWRMREGRAEVLDPRLRLHQRGHDHLSLGTGG